MSINQSHPTTYPLVAELQQGSRPAFTRLYGQYAKPLFRDIYRMMNDRAKAEQFLQELFLTVWHTRHTLDPGVPFRLHLHRITRQLLLAQLHRLSADHRAR